MKKTTKPDSLQIPQPEAIPEETLPEASGIERSLIRLEKVQDYLMDQFHRTTLLEERMKLANALASNCRALFQGYRALTASESSQNPMEKVYNELKMLEFDED